MAVNNATGYNRTTNEPLDALYLNSGSVYASTTEVNSKVNIIVRYTGSMFNVNGELYWYKNGVQDSDLVLFNDFATGSLEGTASWASNSISASRAELATSASNAATASSADQFEIRTVPNATTDTDKFIVLDGTTVKYRTGVEVLSDINAQPSGSYITSLTGEVTAAGPGAASATLLNSAVIGKVLTGLNVTGGTIVATDTILQAFGKAQNQITSLMGGATYQGVWNASTNSPTITSSTGTKGHYYVVNVAGSTNIDGIIYNGATWDKVDNTDAVSSVNGFVGAVSLTTANIPEVTNLYYTDLRARAALSSSATGLTYNSTTGVFTITSGYVIPTTTQETNWNLAYTQTRQWDGGATGLIAATGRASLGLVIGADVLAYRTFGTAANNNTGDFATAAQGTKADTAYGWGDWAAGSHYIGTTLIANNRASGVQTLTGVSIDGNAATATNVTASGVTGGAALSLVDDTNVTISQSGSTTALLAAKTLTLGWTGILSVARGGTGQSTLGGVQSWLGLGSYAYRSSGLAELSGDTFTGTVIGNSGFRVPNGQFFQAVRNTGSAVVNILGFESGTDDLIQVFSNSFKLRNTGAGDAANMFTVSVSGNGTFTGTATATSFIGAGSALTSVPSNAALYPTFNQNTTGTAASLSAVLSSNLGGAGSVSGILKANGSGVVSAVVASDITDLISGTYLPLSGGTLTGALNGTSASFSGDISANSRVLFQTSTSPNAAYQDGYNTAAGRYIYPKAGSLNDFTLYNSAGGVAIKVASGTLNTTLGGALSGTSLSMSGGASIIGELAVGSALLANGYKLNVNGLGRFYGANNALNFGELDANSIYFQALDNGFTTSKNILFLGTAEYGRFASDGTFLINTTTTDGTNKLIVNGGVKFKDAVFDNGLGRLTTEGFAARNVIYSTTTNFGAYNQLRLQASDWSFHNGSAEVASISGSGVATFTGSINGTSLSMSGAGSFLGNVGIGTASPSTNLHVVSTSGGVSQILGATATNGAFLNFQNVGSTIDSYFGSNNSTGTLVGGIGGAYGTFIASYSTRPIGLGINGTEYARLATDGTFLINTTTTDGTNKLIVNGGVKGETITATNGFVSNRTADALSGQFYRSTINGTSVTNNSIVIGKVNTTNNAATFVYTHSSDGSTNNQIGFGFWGNDNLFTLKATGAATFSSSVTASSLIKSGGTSSQFLKADGSVDGNTYLTTSGVAAQVTINYNNDSNSTYQMLWGSGNSVYGTAGIYCNPSTDTIYANGNIIAYASSDSRYKDNQQLITNPISKLLALRGMTFTWNNLQQDFKGNDYGLIYQDVATVMPEITQMRKNGYGAIKYEKVIPLLVEVGKNHEQRIQELEGKLQAYENKFGKLN